MAGSSEPVSAPALVARARAGRPQGPWWLLCLDGRAGSGKTSLAARVATSTTDTDVQVVHLDSLYDGWDGLGSIAASLDRLLSPLREGAEGSHPRYDWHAGRYDGTVRVRPRGLIVVEGVGAGSAPADLIDLLVWLDAAPDVRRTRALARDGATFAPHWDAWARAEAAHFARYPTPEHADVRLHTGSITAAED